MASGNNKEQTVAEEVLGEKQGYKTLNENGINRLKALGKTDGELAYIDKKFKYKNPANNQQDNFANGNAKPSLTTYMNMTGLSESDAEVPYSKMLRYCYPTDYYGGSNQGSEWLKIEFATVYSEDLLDKSKSKNPTVPSFDKFCSYFKKIPYYTTKKIKKGEEIQTVGEFTTRGLEGLDVKYQQYLRDIWPEFWSGKIFNDRTEVTQDNISNNMSKLCDYTYRDILVDTVESPGSIPIEEAHYFAIFCGNDVDKVLGWTESQIAPYRQAISQPVTVETMINMPSNILGSFKMPTDLSSLENSLDTIIEKVQALQAPSGGLPGLLKGVLKKITLPIVAGLVWNKISPYINFDNINNINPNQLSKGALKELLDNFRKNAMDMLKNMMKEVQDTINEIIITAKGLWDNITGLPKTVISMCTSAVLPQTIPTTGGIPNPISVILDIMNIIDSILALFPPIIQDILKILTLCKKLMIPLSQLSFLNTLIQLIIKIIELFKSKKAKALTAAQIHKAVKKALKKIKKLKKKQKKLENWKADENGKLYLDWTNKADDYEEWEEYNESITEVENSIKDLEAQCPIHGKRPDPNAGIGSGNNSVSGRVSGTEGGDEDWKDFDINYGEENDYGTEINENDFIKECEGLIDSLTALVDKNLDFGDEELGDEDENGVDDWEDYLNSLESGNDGPINNGNDWWSDSDSTGVLINTVVDSGNGNTGNGNGGVPVNGSPLQETNITPYCGKIFV